MDHPPEDEDPARAAEAAAAMEARQRLWDELKAAAAGREAASVLGSDLDENLEGDGSTGGGRRLAAACEGGFRCGAGCCETCALEDVLILPGGGGWESTISRWELNWDNWWFALPAATSQSLSGCLGALGAALGVHLAGNKALADLMLQRLRALLASGTASSAAAPPPAAAAAAGCEWVSQPTGERADGLELPAFPEFDQFELLPLPLPRPLPGLFM